MLNKKIKILKSKISELMKINDALFIKVGRQKEIINKQDIEIRNLNDKIYELMHKNEQLKKDLQHEVERRNIDRLELITQIKEGRTKVIL